MFESALLLPAISGVLVSLMAIYVIGVRRTVKKFQRFNAELIDGLSQEVKGVSHGAMGVGRKVLMLEKQIEDLHIKIDEMQKNDPSKVSYSEAARLVELGAGVEDLMNSCGISRPEAELVRALTANRSDKDIPTLSPENML